MLCDKHNAALLLYQMAQPNSLRYLSLPQIDKLLAYYRSNTHKTSEVLVYSTPKCSPVELYSRLADSLLKKFSADRELAQLVANLSPEVDADPPQLEEGLIAQLMGVFYGKVSLLRSRQVIQTAIDKLEKPIQVTVLQAEYLTQESIQELRDLHTHTKTGILLVSDRDFYKTVQAAEGGERFKDLGHSWQYASDRLESALSQLPKDLSSDGSPLISQQKLVEYMQQVFMKIKAVESEISSLQEQEKEMEKKFDEAWLSGKISLLDE